MTLCMGNTLALATDADGVKQSATLSKQRPDYAVIDPKTKTLKNTASYYTQDDVDKYFVKGTDMSETLKSYAKGADLTELGKTVTSNYAAVNTFKDYADTSYLKSADASKIYATQNALGTLDSKVETTYLKSAEAQSYVKTNVNTYLDSVGNIFKCTTGASSTTTCSFPKDSIIDASVSKLNLKDASLTDNLVVNGNASVAKNLTVAGSTSFGSLSPWSPDFRLPSSSFSYNEANDKGYYVFPGGFCVQWGWVADTANQFWDFPKPFLYVYGASVQRTYLNAGSSGSGATAVTKLTTTRLEFDSVHSSGDKSACFAMVWGKV